MSYIPCGCWVGPWHSVNPPPQCAGHAQQSAERALRGPVIPVDLEPGAPPGVYGGARGVGLGTANSPLMLQSPVATLEQAIKAALTHVQTEIAAAMTRGDDVALDAWREAYEQLQHVIIAITRANKTNAARSNNEGTP